MPTQIPTQCKALQLEKPPKDAGDTKGRNVAALRTVDVPKERDGMLLVHMQAAGFNRRDEWGMMDMYPGLTYTNSTFGCDGVGVVVRGTRSDEKQDRLPRHPKGLVVLVPTRGWDSDPDGPEAALPGVPPQKNALGGAGFGLLGCTKPTAGVGTFTEFCQVESDAVANAPAHLTAEQAAALPCGGVTAFRALFSKARVSKGQCILITGIGGGVALLALQLALAAGAVVFVTGGTKDKIERAVQLGARGGVIYRDKDWPQQLAKIVLAKSKDRPYLDAVIDSAGGEVPAQAAKAGLRSGGRIVCFGMTAAPKMTVTMREVLRNVDVLGSTMGSAKEFRDMLHFVSEHKIVPVVDTVLDGLDNAHRGFPLLQDADKRSGGKVVVKIGSSGAESRL